MAVPEYYEWLKELEGSSSAAAENIRQALDEDSYDEEDCSYLLRTIESELKLLVAHRSSKCLWLKRMRNHISDSSYHAELRRAANDKTLSTVARLLNPHYDTHTQWECEGEDPVPRVFDNIPLQEPASIEGKELADRLLRLIHEHNATLEDQNAAMFELINLPEVPYVPERLRLLLRESEKDLRRILPQTSAEMGEKLYANSEGHRRSQVISTPPEDESMDTIEGCRGKRKSRVKKSEGSTAKALQCEESASFQALNCTEPSKIVQPSSSELTSSRPSSSSNSTYAAALTDQPSSSNCKVFQGDIQDDSQQTTDNEKPRKRKSKQRDIATMMCARVQPFIFEPAAPGQKMKPPRGNPDRRVPRPMTPPSVPLYGQPSSAATTQTSTTTTTHATFSTAALSPPPRNPSSNCSVPTVSRKLQFTQAYPYTPSGEMNSKMEGNQLSGRPGTTQGIVRIQPIAPRTFSRSDNKVRESAPRILLRSTNPARYYASPVSSHNNPARPFYGNPSTAAVGTVRSFSAIAPGTYAVTATSSGISSSHTVLPQTIPAGEIERIVAQAAVSSQSSYRAMKKSPSLPRSSYVLSPTNVRVSTVSTLASLPSSSMADPCTTTSGSPTSGSKCNTSAAIHLPFRVSHSTLPPASAHDTVCAEYSSITVDSSARGHHNGTHQFRPDVVAAGSPPVKENDDAVERERNVTIEKMDKDGSLIKVNNDSTEEVRLECDEVMMPEQRYMLSPSTADLDSFNFDQNIEQLSRLPQSSVSTAEFDEEAQNGNPSHHGISAQYTNGIIHQDEQNSVKYVTSQRCIR